MNMIKNSTRVAALLMALFSGGRCMAIAAPATPTQQQMDIEPTIKMLYTQMQAAQGKTFDAAAQGNFGAALVDAYNTVLDVQSYMNQLLTAAAQTPLLNAAQQQYVQKVMIPNLSQVSSLTQTKPLDQVVAATPKPDAQVTTPATPATSTAATTTGKKKRKKKVTTVGTATTPAAATPSTTPTPVVPAPAVTPVTLPVVATVAPAAATTTPVVTPATATAASTQTAPVVKKKRKKKKVDQTTQQVATPAVAPVNPAPSETPTVTTVVK